jgi:PAS domain S-box-containing protein
MRPLPTHPDEEALPAGRAGPGPRLRARQVAELYRYATPAAAFSYGGALLTLGVLVETGDAARGSLWFLFATLVATYRLGLGIAYRRHAREADAGRWAALAIAGNFAAGVQWAWLGTALFPETAGYRQLYTIMVIACFVGGSVAAYAPVRWAHEALSIPATVPTAIYLFFLQDGAHWLAGVTALLFCAAIVGYARASYRDVEARLRLELERDDLVELTDVLNAKLQQENRELAHRVAMRGLSAESARGRAERLEALFERSPLPHLECDDEGIVIACNDAMERLAGTRAASIVGRPIAELLAWPAVPRSADGALVAGSLETTVRNRDGVPIPCVASFAPLPAPGGLGHGFAVALSGVKVLAEVK